MQIEIRYQPSYALALVTLDAGETIQAESGAMVGMSLACSCRRPRRAVC